MNDMNLIESCQAHLLCNALRTSKLLAGSDMDVVIKSEPRLRTAKTIILFAPLAVIVYTGCSAFSILHSNKPLIRLHIKYKTVLYPKL